MLKLKEFYWTVTGLFGLKWLHGLERHYARILYKKTLRYFIPVLRFIYYPLPLRLLTSNRRFVPVPSSIAFDIGVFSLALDSWLKDGASRRVHYAYTVLLHRCLPEIEQVADLWSDHVRICKPGLLSRLLQPLTFFPGLTETLEVYAPDAARSASRSHLAQTAWNGRPPLARLPPSVLSRGRANVLSLGLDEGAWFVCIDTRCPSSYYALPSSQALDASDFEPAIAAVRRHGGWCVCIGDGHRRERGDRVLSIDIRDVEFDTLLYVLTQGRAFVGGTSLSHIAGVLGVSSALCNIAPLDVVYSPFPQDTSIPKLTMDSGRLLTFAEEMSFLGYEHRRMPRRPRTAVCLANDGRDIAEQLDFVLGGPASSVEADRERQERFRRLLKAEHHCWHAGSRISPAFLQRHAELLT